MAGPTRTICVVCAVAFSTATASAFTQVHDQAAAYPSRPVRLINSGGAGGALDIPARALAERFRDRLGQPLVVDNRPTAGGTVAVGLVARAAADGYTLIYSFAGPLVHAPSLYSALPYDVKKDLTPVVFVGRLPFVLAVSTASGISGVEELIIAARKQAGKLNYGSAGNGSATHLTMELFKSGAKLVVAHVPYNGGAPAATALAIGDVQAAFLPVAVLMPHVRSGRVRLIGVSSIKRLPMMPDVPTIAESGLPGFDADGWQGILAPIGTPREIVLRVNRAINESLALAEMRVILARNEIHVGGGTPEQFGQLIESESKKWAPVITFTGAKLD
jgi:tripartite-type tricarboxylate transporter receptor subunit TctC